MHNNLLVNLMLGRTLGKSYKFNSKPIEETVKKALNDGDLSELKNLGPAVQKAVNSFIFGTRSRGDIPHSTPQYTTQDTPQGAAQNAAQNAAQGSMQTGASPAAQPPQPDAYPPPQPGSVRAAHPFSASSDLRRTNQRISRGFPQIVLGSVGAFFFIPATFVFLASLLTMTELPTLIVGVVLTVLCAAAALASVSFLVTGIGKYGLADRAVRLSKLLQGKKVCTLDELAAETGRSRKQIKRDLRKIRARNMIPEIRTDADGTCVMWGQDTYEQHLRSEEARMQKIAEEADRRQRLENPATADIEHFRSEGEAVILKIRAANDVIHGEEISAKLDTLEAIVTRIFTYVERYPEKLPSTRRFMNHYLPTTLKLVEKYHQYDTMDFEPQNVRQAKEEIERSMDTINVAFNNLLENLFTHDTLDVSTDIKVLENMLEQEGLIGDEFKIDQPGSA